MEDLGIIIALLGGVIGLMAVIIALFLWNRAEARKDWDKADNENKQLRRDLIDVMRMMQEDMRDFHGRLCTIEERRLKEK